MLRFCHQNKGAISVFLTLILLPVLLFGGLTVDAARIYMSKVVISDAGEMAMNAGLARYHGKLHDEYGLLVMEKSPAEMKDDLAVYFEKSLNGKGVPGTDDYKAILDLVSEQFEVINLDGSQIYQSEVEKQQIIEYMKYRAPICLTELILDKLKELKDMKKKSEAMTAQMDFGEAMEDCHDSMEEAKAALDALNGLIGRYPSQSEIEHELELTQKDYTIQASRCLLMIAAISHYTGADSRGDAEEAAKSFIIAASKVSLGEDADSEVSFDSYISCLYYQNGVVNAGGLDKVLNTWRASEPGEGDPNHSAWKGRMDELEELDRDYRSAKEAVSKYSNRLREIAYKECIVPHTATLHGYREDSKNGHDLAQKAYEKLEEVKKKLEDAAEKWEDWSVKTSALGDGAGAMQESVDEYGKFFADGDPANDMDNLGLLMEDVKTDMLYFNEMRDILTEEKFFDLSIAISDADKQYKAYWSKADEAGKGAESYVQIRDRRDPSYISNYVHTTISTAYVMMRIDSSPFYEKLREYCGSLDTPESTAKKNEVNGKLDEGAKAGESAKSEDEYKSLTYMWKMDSSMPSVALELVAPDDAEDGAADLGGNVNNKKGRKNAISKFRESIAASTSFLDGLDRIISDNLENLYIAEYVMQMFSYYTVDKRDGALLGADEIIGLSGYKLGEHKAYKAEIEYILWGNASSAVNVSKTFMMLFGVRMLLNSFFACTNKEITSMARGMAAVIAGAAPYLIPVVQVIIELALAGIETAADIAKLKDGYGVTILKSRESWTGLGGDNTSGVTLDYSEYLRIFLNVNMLVGQEDKKLARIADCIRVNTDYNLVNGYTMLAIEAKVGVRTTFMKRISDLGYGEWKQPGNTYTVLYQSILGY